METLLNIKENYTIGNIYLKHVSHKRYTYSSRLGILSFCKEVLCECFTKNLNVEKSINFLKEMLNITQEELYYVLNSKVMMLNNFTLLDVCMKNWSIGAYDSFHFGSNVYTYFVPIKRFDDIKTLVEFGAHTVLQNNNILISNSIFFTNPPDFHKIDKYIYGKIMYASNKEILNQIRKCRRQLKSSHKICAKNIKQSRTEKYKIKLTNDEIECKRQEKIQRRKEWICAICLDTTNSFQTKYTLKECKHKFHTDCFMKYLLNNDKNNTVKKCPYCRKIL